MSTLEVRDVGVSFGGLVAWESVSFDVVEEYDGKQVEAPSNWVPE